MMRTSYLIPLVILLLVGTGFSSAESQAIPDLIGNWTGTYVGHEQEGGYGNLSEWIILLAIMEQKERVFNGTISYQKKSDDNIDGTHGFSGAVGPDLKSIYLAEYSNGISIGQIIDPDTLEIIYLDSGKKGSVAIYTFTRDTSDSP
ncbi:MAG: hypothetical protein V1862_03695 [Methanobacteriota archaeon]